MILGALGKWQNQELRCLLHELPDVLELEKKVRAEITQVMSSLHEQIIQPDLRKTAQDTINSLSILTQLQSSVFQEAKLSLMEKQSLLKMRNVEDDKTIQWHLSEFADFQSLRDLLGKPPAKGATGEAAKTFHQRLSRVADAFNAHVKLAAEGVTVPHKFAEEMKKLTSASNAMGDVLKASEATCNVARVAKMPERFRQKSSRPPKRLIRGKNVHPCWQELNLNPDAELRQSLICFRKLFGITPHIAVWQLHDTPFEHEVGNLKSTQSLLCFCKLQSTWWLRLKDLATDQIRKAIEQTKVASRGHVGEGIKTDAVA